MDEHVEHNRRVEKQIIETVEQDGYFIALFNEDGNLPSFGYTIGLWKTFSHPEIITFGIDTNELYSILESISDRIKSGEKIDTSKEDFEVFESYPVKYCQVESDNMPDYFGYGLWFYNYEPFPALQMIWTDRRGKYPGDDGFDDKFKYSQPSLCELLEFKFYQPRNLAVFADKRIFSENKSINYVVYDNDGDYQFLTGERAETENLAIYPLESIVRHDATINELFNLPRQMQATRQYVGGTWFRQELEMDESE